MKWVFLTLAILTEVMGTTALKFSDGFTKIIPTSIVVVGYGVSFYFLSLSLRSMPVGVAYAIWSGIGITLISLIGWFFLNQRLDTATLVGIGFIIAGVIIINGLSKNI